MPNDFIGTKTDNWYYSTDAIEGPLLLLYDNIAVAMIGYVIPVTTDLIMRVNVRTTTSAAGYFYLLSVFMLCSLAYGSASGNSIGGRGR